MNRTERRAVKPRGRAEWFNCLPPGDYSNKPRTCRLYSKWLVLGHLVASSAVLHVSIETAEGCSSWVKNSLSPRIQEARGIYMAVIFYRV